MLPSLRVAGLLSSLLILGACAGSDKGPAEEQPASEGRVAACFNASAVRAFRPVDRSRLIVYTSGRNRAYLVRIAPASSRLTQARRIDFGSDSGRICGYPGERLYFGSALGPGSFVADVERLDAVALQALEVSNDPDAKLLEPEKNQGAKIEPLSDADGDDANNNEQETSKP